MMDQVIEKTQRREFANQTLPDLFHAAPDQFLFYLERDGIKVIHFYWNETAKKLAQSEAQPAFGMGFEIRKPNPRTTVILIRLPSPQNPGEAYFSALCYRPYRVMPLGWLSDTTKVLTLEKALTENQMESSLLVEWDKRHGRDVIGRGTQPEQESFYRAVLAEIRD
jgi:hypothetical protein